MFFCWLGCSCVVAGGLRVNNLDMGSCELPMFGFGLLNRVFLKLGLIGVGLVVLFVTEPVYFTIFLV